MHKNIYKKVSSYLKEGMYVLLVTTFQGKSGMMSEGLKKVMHVNSNKCEYLKPETIHMEGPVSTYEPMVLAELVPESKVVTGLDLDVVFQIPKESDEIVVATLLEGIENSVVKKGMKMYLRKDGSTVGHIGDEALNRQIIELGKSMFGSGEYRYVLIEDKDMNVMYTVLLEDMVS